MRPSDREIHRAEALREKFGPEKVYISWIKSGGRYIFKATVHFQDMTFVVDITDYV